MIYDKVRDAVPTPVRKWVQHFETSIDEAVAAFATSLPQDSRVLDAGAGEGNYQHHFARQLGSFGQQEFVLRREHRCGQKRLHCLSLRGGGGTQCGE